MNLDKVIRTIPDFPEPGVLFRDITTVLQDPDALVLAVDTMTDQLQGLTFDLVAGPESRGFIFGVPAAYKLRKGFIPVRKAGKLPYQTIQKSYALEYGQALIEMHRDAIQKGQRVVVMDDLLATGGTCKALAEMIEEVGGVVAAMVFFIELQGLNGRERLKDYDVRSIVKF
ncbi:MAG: adenine phosphoribosyltransferase [Clostridiales bacterium]|jgi:adenine phosphoribosyltransferase|nr:adenine phosphoribosyltransferase [Clostridiales bacterium]